MSAQKYFNCGRNGSIKVSLMISSQSYFLKHYLTSVYEGMLKRWFGLEDSFQWEDSFSSKHKALSCKTNKNHGKERNHCNYWSFVFWSVSIIYIIYRHPFPAIQHSQTTTSSCTLGCDFVISVYFPPLLFTVPNQSLYPCF